MTEQSAICAMTRGRTGTGRHTLLASLAARAGRDLGVIDVATVPREANALAAVLEAVLRRALLRGLIPCVDGLEVVSADESRYEDRVDPAASTPATRPGGPSGCPA